MGRCGGCCRAFLWLLGANCAVAYTDCDVTIFPQDSETSFLGLLRASPHTEKADGGRSHASAAADNDFKKDNKALTNIL